jgi:hypothetical protein
MLYCSGDNDKIKVYLFRAGDKREAGICAEVGSERLRRGVPTSLRSQELSVVHGRGKFKCYPSGSFWDFFVIFSICSQLNPWMPKLNTEVLLLFPTVVTVTNIRKLASLRLTSKQVKNMTHVIICHFTGAETEGDGGVIFQRHEGEKEQGKRGIWLIRNPGSTKGRGLLTQTLA